MLDVGAIALWVDVPPEIAGTALCRDPADDKFLHAALAAGAGWLISGDQDLLVLARTMEELGVRMRIEMLEKDKDAAGSTATRNKIAKQIESLKKKHVKLLAYDEKLRHYADVHISLDLGDGVKVNYGNSGICWRR